MPTVEVGDARLHVEDDGAADPAVVLLHSFPLDGRMWDQQRRHLVPDRRVVIPDLRGAGRSEAPGDPGSYSIDGWAADVLALLNLLEIERPMLVGAGSGATVALALTRLSGDLPGGLLLAGPWPDSALPTEVRDKAEQERWLATGGDLAYFADLMLRGVAAADTPGRSDVAKLVRFSVADAPRAGLIGGLEALRQRDAVQGDLGGIDVPVWLVRGEHDPLTTTADLEQMRDQVPDAQVTVVPACGHLVNVEAPAAFDQLLDDLLATV